MTELFNGRNVCLGSREGSLFYAAQSIRILTLLATSFGLFEGL